jgi:hypothetical protein
LSSAKQRKVRSKVEPSALSRSPKTAHGLQIGTDLDLGNSQPCWNFGLIDHSHEGSWDWKITSDESETFLKFLSDMQKLSWNEIRALTTGKHKKNHDMPTESLCKEAKDRLGEIGLGDQESLFRFRLSGKVRLWGLFLGRRHEFHILWWDRDHEVYPTD